MSNLIQFPIERKPIAATSQSVKGLTPREAEVVLLVEHTNREIGKILGIAIKTVKAHLRAIFYKLGVTNRTQALMTYLEMIQPIEIIQQTTATKRAA